MQIIINQKDDSGKQKTKFFKMAALFAEEYNKYAADEDKVKIIIPYSFLLSKGKLLFPESIAAATGGDEEGKFIRLTQAKPELFEFVFTKEDEKLYGDIYASASTLLSQYKESRKSAASRKKEQASDETQHQPFIDDRVVQHLRHQGDLNNRILRTSGQDIDTWFKDRELGKVEDGKYKKFPELDAVSESAPRVTGPGLFLAMLQSSEIRKQIDIPESLKSCGLDFPPIDDNTRAAYQSVFTQLSAVIERINEDISARKERNGSAARRRVESMKAPKGPVSPFTEGQMTIVLQQADRYSKVLSAIDSNWMESHGVAAPEHVLDVEKAATSKEPTPKETSPKATGAALFQALVLNNKIRAELIHDNEIQEVSAKSMDGLALALAGQGKKVVYALDDKDFFEKLERPNPEFTPRETIKEVDEFKWAPDKEAFGAEVPRTIKTYPNLDMPKTGKFYAYLKDQLSKFKEGHAEDSERVKSIDSVLAEMHKEISRSGHGSSAAKSNAGMESELKPGVMSGEAEVKIDPVVHGNFAGKLRAVADEFRGTIDPEVIRPADRSWKKALHAARGKKPGGGQAGTAKS